MANDGALLTLAEMQEMGVRPDDAMAVNVSATLALILQDDGLKESERDYILGALKESLVACASLSGHSEFSVGTRVGMLHGEIDKIIREDRANLRSGSADIKCKPQCANCCHIAVSVSDDEAAVIMSEVRRQGRKLDVDHLRRQLGWGADEWPKLSVEDSRCVLLGDDGNCTVYDVRPAACRKYFSVTEPEFCNAKKYPKQQVSVWYSLRAEILDSASMSVFGVDHMPSQLLKAMNAVERG